MSTLAVVGAGPKGIAIAAKARAVAAAGLDAPRVVLVERSAVAGNWSGRQGYTSGLLPLGTPAEKDVGFPYADSWGAATPAASIVISLLAKSHKRSTVDVLTSRGVLYSRGESYDENRFYSHPGDWPHLAESHRREFLVRTDRGVFSSQAEAILNASHGFRTLAGRAVRIEAGQDQVVVTIEYGPERERVAYDLVVVGIGFQARWFERLLGGHARGRLASALAGDELERRIELDLSVAGLNPPLHLPLVAGLAQGPGFPNLSCLGLLSDRVLRRYVPVQEPAAVAPERRERV